MTEKDVQDALFRYFNAYRGYAYQLCNAYVFKWECDFFCLASSGYAYEIEVKTSRGDFFNDFNKEEKHRILSADKTQPVKVGKAYAATQTIKNGKKCREVIYSPFIHPTKRMWRRNRWPLRTNIKWIDPSTQAPNKFLYAVPEDMVSVDEVPDYAGLVYIPADRRKKPSIIKKPPAIHRKKNDYTEILLKKYYWAYLNSLGHKKEGKNFDFPE